MYPNQKENNSQKVVASIVIILAVAILAVSITVLAKKANDRTNADAATTATSTISTTGSSPSTGSSSGTTNSSGTSSDSGSSNSGSSTTATSYKDGTYTASSDYSTPGGTEGITVTITIQGDTVTSASITQDASNRDSEEYQNAFAGSYKSYVVGKSLSSISVSRISGASLTTRGFSNALSQIKSQAQS